MEQSVSVEVKSGIGENVKTKELEDDVQMHSSAARGPVKMTVPNLGELKERLIDILEYAKNKDDDSHDIHTPFDLCDDVISKIPSLHGNILVVTNLEFIYTLIWRKIDPTKIFFATPSKTKAKVSESILRGAGNVNSIKNIFLYNNVITKEDVGDMKFDVMVMNPPYSGTLYHDFMMHALQSTDFGAAIIPAAFMTGSQHDDIKLRRALLDSGVERIVIHPMGTFENVQKITAAIFWNKRKSKANSVQVERANHVTNMHYSADAPWVVPYGALSLSILQKAEKYAGTLVMHQGRNNKPKVPHCVAFGEKVAFNQVGWGDRYDRAIAGNVCPMTLQDNPTEAMKRFIVVKTAEEAAYLSAYMQSKLFNILGSMIGVEKNATKSLFARIPLLIDNRPFDMEHAMDTLLGLTADEKRLINDL